MPLSTTEAILLSWECCSVIPNADGGGQNNRHTTLLMTCAPQFRLCPRGNVGCGGKTRPDRPFYYELLRGNREHTLPYDRYLSMEEVQGGSFFFGFRNIISVHGGRNSAGANTEGGLFFLNGGSNILHVHQDSSSLPNVPSVR